MNDSAIEDTEGSTGGPADRDWCPSVPMARGSWGRAGFQLVWLGAFLEEMADERLGDSGMDGRGYCILATLSVDEPPSQHELATLLGKAPGVIVAEIDTLESAGYVQRNRDPKDRRRSRVTLTPAGKRALARADELANAAVAEIMGGLDSDELVQFRRLLDKGLGLAQLDSARAAEG